MVQIYRCKSYRNNLRVYTKSRDIIWNSFTLFAIIAKTTLLFKGEITLENEIRVANNVRVVKLHFFVQDFPLQFYRRQAIFLIAKAILQLNAV